MSIVDERGRLFGRWNLLDLGVLVLLLGLIPLGYAGFVLFHGQPPQLLSIEPTTIKETDSFTLHLKGVNFRPYMRVSLGAQQGREFLFKSTEEADVPFAAVPPGTYDVILFDQAQERSRLRQVLTISPSSLPSTAIVAVGAFGNLDATMAAQLTPGTQLSSAGEIIAVGKPVPDVTDVFAGSRIVGVSIPNALRVPAIVRFNCFIVEQAGQPFCSIDRVAIAPRNIVRVPLPSGQAPFQVQRVRGPQPLQETRVALRATGPSSVLSKIKAGDVDTGGIDNELEVIARVTSVGGMRQLGNGSAEIDITLAANLQRVNDVWMYDSTPLRAGAPLLFRTNSYEVSAVVTDIAEPRQ